MTDPKEALDELMFMAQGTPGRIGLLCGCIRAALESKSPAPQAAAHRELFLAAYALLADRRSDAAFTRLYNAMGALDDFYGVDSPEAFQALDAVAMAARQPADALGSTTGAPA